jgi:hypothetical protein
VRDVGLSERWASAVPRVIESPRRSHALLTPAIV